MRYKELVKSATTRFLADYAKKLGIPTYEDLLIDAQERGYEVISLAAFYERLRTDRLQNNDARVFLNRHDIDVDVKTARKMFQVEKELGVTSTFYFRLSTLDVSFIREIKNYGSEVGYHFEEIATFAKKHKIKNKKDLQPWLNEISKLFLENLNRIESAVGFKIKSVVSHGDFVNRSWEYNNNEIVDEALKKRGGIDFEAYELVPYFDKWLVDAPYPEFWRQGSPFMALKEEARIICLLTHPRHWGRNFWANTKANIRRVIEGIAWEHT